MMAKSIHFLVASLVALVLAGSLGAVYAQEAPAGTPVVVRLTDRLDTDTNKTGDRFQAILDQDILVGSRTVVGAGAPVTGKLLEVRPSGRVSGRARMSLTLTEIGVGSTLYPIETNTITVEASGSTGRDAGIIGGTAVLGALIGAIAGGGTGAAIGAASGAGAGTAVVLVTQGRDVKFEPEQKFQFTLAAPLRVGGVGPFTREGTRDGRYGTRRSEPGNYPERAQVYGQRGQIADIARQLDARAQRMWEMARSRRSELRGQEGADLYLALSNFANSTRVFAEAVEMRNPSALNGQARTIVNQTQRVARLMDQTDNAYDLRDNWREVEDQVVRLSDVYALNYSPRRELARTDPYYQTQPEGRGYFRWRGRVDGSDYIMLRGDRVLIRHLQAQNIVGASFDLPSPLPRRPVTVHLNRIQGRGRVEVVQQPSASNNYTVAVLIEDNQAGDDWYEFELSW